MKLDPRIIEGKKPLTCFDVEEAKQFIGEKGYFAGKLTQFCDLSKTQESVLKNVWPNETYCFIAFVTGYKYFLPCEWVQEKKEKQPKYRPYKDYDEMSQDFYVGQLITYKHKDRNCIHHAEIVEAFIHTDGDMFIGIGNSVKSISGWFQTIEVKDPETDAWVPFGVLEE